MSLKIDLGLESKSYRVNDEVSPYDALLDVAAAQEALTRLSMEDSVLTKSMDETIAGLEFARSMKEATSNDKVGLAVAKESISRSLGMIGNESIATGITAGASDLNSVVAATENIFKKMWEKAKEYAKKIWDWIRNLIAKAVDFVKGIFGKNGDVASDVLEELKKLEKEKRTNLEDDEFPEAVRNRLAPKVGVALASGNDLTTNVMVNFLTSTVDKSTILDEAKKELNELIARADTLVDAGLTSTGKEGKYTYGNEDGTGGDNNDDNKDNDNNDELDDLSKAIAKYVPSSTEVEGDDIDGLIKDAVEDITDIDKYKATIVGKLPNKLIAVVKYTTDKYEEKMAKYNSDKTKITDLKAALNEVKVTKVEASVEEKDALDNAEHVIPIDFTDAKSFAETLKNRLKKEISNLDKLKKDVDKTAKDAIKALDSKKEAKGDAVIIYTKLQNLLRDSAKIIVEGAVAQANANVRNEFMTIVKESMRLYKKV